MIDIFDGLTVYGYEITPKAVRRAIRAAAEKKIEYDAREFDVYFIEKSLWEDGVPVYIGMNYISRPAASRIIARLKRAGMVWRSYGRGFRASWQWTAKGKKWINRMKVVRGWS